MNRVYLCMLQHNSMYSSIVDAFDQDMTELCKGNSQWFVDLVFGVMDGKEYDYSTMKKEEVDVVKTAKVILGHSLFSPAGWTSRDFQPVFQAEKTTDSLTFTAGKPGFGLVFLY